MDILALFKKITLIRVFEEKIDYLFKRGLINGTAHFCVGQEFIPVIISQYLKKEDSVTSTHRGHGHAFARGLDSRKLLAELIGRKIGYNSGKGGSQHIVSREDNFFSNGITGGMVPIANGIAFAEKYNKTKNIVVAYLGDGAFNEGYVQEALNLAKVFNLPILFVCENNHYAMSTHIRDSHSNEIIKRVEGLGIKSKLISDNNFKDLNETSKRFIDQIREKSEPYFIEVRTYRHYGHSKNDMNLYREKEEENYWMERDVLKKIRNELIANSVKTEEEINEIEKRIRKEIDDLTQEVLGLPKNDIQNVLEGVLKK